jgi:hypothetical protein
MLLQEKIIAILCLYVYENIHKKDRHNNICSALLASYEKKFGQLSPEYASFIIFHIKNNIGDGLFINELLLRGGLPKKDSQLTRIMLRNNKTCGFYLALILGTNNYSTISYLNYIVNDQLFWMTPFSSSLITLVNKVNQHKIKKWLQEFNKL